MSLDAMALKNLFPFGEFQTCLLFLISLLLKNFFKALYTVYMYISQTKQGQSRKT